MREQTRSPVAAADRHSSDACRRSADQNYERHFVPSV
jgi:hypothetical protein